MLLGTNMTFYSAGADALLIASPDIAENTDSRIMELFLFDHQIS